MKKKKKKEEKKEVKEVKFFIKDGQKLSINRPH